MEVIEKECKTTPKQNKKIEKQNLKIDILVIFHPYANFNCPYFKIGLCNFPVLLECITNVILQIAQFILSMYTGN